MSYGIVPYAGGWTEVPNLPTDTISRCMWLPMGDGVLASSWDGNTYVWTRQASVFAPMQRFNHGAPVLDLTVTPDGSGIYTAGCDNQVCWWSPTRPGQKSVVARHTAPISSVHFMPEHQLLLVGSWDSHLAIWDARAPARAPARYVKMPGPVHSVHSRQDYIAASAGPNNMYLLQISTFGSGKPISISLSRKTKGIPANLNIQYGVRDVCFSSDARVCYGCIAGGRIYMYMTQEVLQPQWAAGSLLTRYESKSYRAHRSEGNIHSINCLSPHPTRLAVLSGSDMGVLFVHKKEPHSRDFVGYEVRSTMLGNGKPCLTACAYSPNGRELCCATGYVWSRGQTDPAATSAPTKLYVGPCT